MKKIITLMLSALLFFACGFDAQKLERISVSGEIIREQKYLENYQKVVIAGPFDIKLDQNGVSELSIETYESLMQWVTTEVLPDGTLLLYLKDTSKTRFLDIRFEGNEYDDLSESAILSGSRLKWPENKKLLNVVLSADELESIQIMGESHIELMSTLRSDEFNFEVAGAVHLEGDIDMKRFTVDLAGAGNLDLSGRVNYFDINCAGAGTVKAYDLIANDVNLEVAGVCNAQVFAFDNLNVEIAGMGTIKYKGDPAVRVDKAGIGSVKKVNSEPNDVMKEI